MKLLLVMKLLLAGGIHLIQLNHNHLVFFVFSDFSTMSLYSKQCSRDLLPAALSGWAAGGPEPAGVQGQGGSQAGRGAIPVSDDPHW